MTWISGKLLKWPFGGTALVEQPAHDDTPTGRAPLMMLAADASGLASFQLYSFTDTDTAVHFIRRSFGDRSDTGLIAFWAMAQKPAISSEPGADNKLEAIVMIRDGLRPEVVYPFSFVDIATAQTFVRYEMKRGVDPNHVLVYWAVPVQLGITNDGDLRLLPENPPAVDQNDSSEDHAAVGAQSGLEDSVTDVNGLGRTVTLDSNEIFVSSDGDPIEALFITASAPLEREPAQSILPAAEQAPVADDRTDTHEASVEVTEFSDRNVAVERNEEPMTKEQGPNEVHMPDDLVWSGHDDTGEIRPAAHLQGTRIEFRAGKPSDKQELFRKERVRDVPTSDLPVQELPGQELRGVLSVRRWEEHTEPFTGFQSPPGRF